jgi:hypothetical protein
MEMASLGPGQMFAEGCCYEEMKQGWSGKVKKELTFLQIKSETFTENVDKLIYKVRRRSFYHDNHNNHDNHQKR